MTAASASGDRLCVTMASVLGIEPGELTEDSSPDSVPAWDSLNHLNIVMAVEGEFGIALSADEALEMGSVRLIRAVLSTHEVKV